MAHMLTAIALWLAAAPVQTTAAPTEIIRGIYCHPGAAVDNRVWAVYGAGYAEDTAEKHGGKASVRCVNATDQDAHGALQTVQFDQEEPRPIIVAGWAKLEGVTGPADYRNSVYLDLRLTNGESWPMKIAAFDPAKIGWQYSEQTYTPPVPIESARVYCFLRERKGTAWFDDLYVGEVLDDKGTRSKNLLRDPGLEGQLSGEASFRKEFFAKLEEIGCNAFHFYRGVGWDKIMGDDPSAVPAELPAIDPKDPLLDFVQDSHRRGFKVWLTVGLRLPRIESTKSPWFPFWPCVNGAWGRGYTRAIAYFAQYGFDGLGMVPDEWNYHNGAVKGKGWVEHPDPEVASFYKTLPHYCACDVCRRSFRDQTGMDLPDLKQPWRTADPVWAAFTKFRYDSTSAWMKRSVESAKRVKPDIVTDTMICVLPVCSDDRRSTGAAWDQLGVETGLDCLQTDPYLFLHNYLGDSTHYYATETAIHLASANWKATAGVTLEACPLRETYRDKEPAEVYGAALSCLAHGATEFFWWHMNYLQGKSKFVDPVPASKRVAAAYQVMKAMEPDLLKARVPGEILVLYSRASEDMWHWLAGLPESERAEGTPLHHVLGDKPNPKRGFIAHRNVLYWLLRRGYPFQTTFLDNPDPARLREAKVLIVPFPFALSEAQAKLLEDQAEAGKAVILMSECSPVDERGKPLPRERLGDLARKDAVVSLDAESATHLLQPMEPMKDPQGVVPIPPFDVTHTKRLERALGNDLLRRVCLFAEQPKQDVEATMLRGADARLLLLINWDPVQTAEIRLQSSALGRPRRAQGYAIARDASVVTVSQDCSPDPWTVTLAPQEARLLALTGDQPR